VRHTLKTPYRDGITHIVLEPLELTARLAALVPPPRMHLALPRRVRAAQPAARPTGHAGRRIDRPRTVGLSPGPGLLARYANSPGTGRWFDFPIRIDLNREEKLLRLTWVCSSSANHRFMAMTNSPAISRW
jgi:hypothetical protein